LCGTTEGIGLCAYPVRTTSALDAANCTKAATSRRSDAQAMLAATRTVEASMAGGMPDIGGGMM
jgi:hypothetical protein